MTLRYLSFFTILLALVTPPDTHAQERDIDYWKQQLDTIQSPQRKAKVINEIAILHYHAGDVLESTKWLLKEHEMHQQSKDTAALIISLANLGPIYLSMDKYEEGLKYSQEAMAILQLHPMKLRPSAGIPMNIANAFEGLGKLDSADHYYQIALDSVQRDSNAFDQAVVYANYGNFLVKYGKFYGLDYDLRALELLESVPSDMGTHTTMTTIAKDYLTVGQPLKALAIMEQIQQDTSFRYSYFTTPQLLSEIHEALGNYQEALEYHQAYVSQRDSIELHERQEIERQVDRYQEERKAAELDRLRLENELEKAENSRKSILNIALFSISMLLLALLAVLFIFLQRNRKTNQLLAQQNQALELERMQLEFKAFRAQIKPHFIFNALNSIQKFIAQNDRDSSFEYLGRFGDMIRAVLEHSNQQVVILQDEIDALNNYIAIERLRFDRPFTFTIKLDDPIDPYAVNIPPMLIQPFIENAIWHGLTNQSGTGSIVLRIKLIEEILRIEVQDDGPGFSWKPELDQSKQQGHGISITQQRLEVLWSKRSGTSNLSILPHQSGVGTLVRFDIPSDLF